MTGRYLSQLVIVVFFQAEDGIRDLVRSRGLGDVYKRQPQFGVLLKGSIRSHPRRKSYAPPFYSFSPARSCGCLLYTSDAADERSSVDLGGRRIIKKKTAISPQTVYLLHKNKHMLYIYHIYHRNANKKKQE